MRIARAALLLVACVAGAQLVAATGSSGGTTIYTPKTSERARMASEWGGREPLRCLHAPGRGFGWPVRLHPRSCSH